MRTAHLRLPGGVTARITAPISVSYQERTVILVVVEFLVLILQLHHDEDDLFLAHRTEMYAPDEYVVNAHPVHRTNEDENAAFVQLSFNYHFH